PPELARDAPVADVFVPGLEGLGVAFGVEAQGAFPRLRKRARSVSVGQISQISLLPQCLRIVQTESGIVACPPAAKGPGCVPALFLKNVPARRLDGRNSLDVTRAAVFGPDLLAALDDAGLDEASRRP